MRQWTTMTSVLLDASALLAALRGEPGADVVARHLDGAQISTVNLSEVYAKATKWQVSIEAAIEITNKLPMLVLPFVEAEAAIAASLLPQGRPLGLSFADRACLAVGMNRGLTVLTADRRLKEGGFDVKHKFIR